MGHKLGLTKKSTNELKNVSAKASANVSTIFSFLNFNFGKAQSKGKLPPQDQPATGILAGKAFAHDILIAGAILRACPKVEEKEDVFEAARDFINGVADALKEKKSDQKLVDNFLRGAHDTIDRVSGILSDSNEET